MLVRKFHFNIKGVIALKGAIKSEIWSEDEYGMIVWAGWLVGREEGVYVSFEEEFYLIFVALMGIIFIFLTRFYFFLHILKLF